MSAMRSTDEVGRELAEYIAGACEVSSAAVYLLRGSDQSSYRLSGEVGHVRFAPSSRRRMGSPPGSKKRRRR